MNDDRSDRTLSKNTEVENTVCGSDSCDSKEDCPEMEILVDNDERGAPLPYISVLSPHPHIAWEVIYFEDVSSVSN